MTDEGKSLLALNQFKSILKKKEKYGNDGYKFKALVVYDALGTIITEILECVIIISGYQPIFRINTDNSGILITEDIYHLDFNPFYSQNNTFKYNTTNQTFNIYGNNSRKLGKYKVTISEV